MTYKSKDWVFTLLAAIILVVGCIVNLNTEVEGTEPVPFKEGVYMDCHNNPALRWAIKNGVLFIKGEGDIPNYSSLSERDWRPYSSQVNVIHIGRGITSVGDGAFEDFINLKSVIIPDSVTSIGSDAFYNSGVTSIAYEGSEYQWGRIDVDGGNTPIYDARVSYEYYEEFDVTDLTYTSEESNDVTESSTGTTESAAQVQREYKYSHDMTVMHHVEIEVKDYGTIKLELDPTYAPITVDNFLCLAVDGFYDGLTFHRIMKNFMIQGGDPEHDGTGSSGKQILGEFSDNGVYNPLKHERGVISMARSGYSMDSASCQFFICDKTSDFLDGQYAAFGWVTEGMDVVDAIADAAQPTDDNGTIPFEEQPVITKVTVID